MLAGCGEVHDAYDAKKDGALRALAIAASESDVATPDDAARRTVSPQERKIIHDIEFQIVVTDFSDVPQQIDKLVADFDGAYIAQMNVSGSEGESRSGRWQIRVPNDSQATFLDRV